MTVTRRWQAGLELGDTGEFSAVSNATASTTQKKTGSYALQLAASTDNAYAERTVTGTRQLQMGQWIRPQLSLLTSFDAYFLTLYDVGSTVLVRIGSDGTLDNMELWVGGVLQDSANDPSWGTWQHWGLDVKIASSGGWVRLYRDGVVWLEYTGNTGDVLVAKIRLGTYGTNLQFASAVYVDDLFLDDMTGEAAGPVSQYQFLWMGATGNGAHNDWTGSDGNGTDNYLLVDDVPPDGDTSYVKTDIAEQESFVVGNVTVPVDFVVTSVIPTARAKKTDGAGSNELKLLTRLSGTDAVGGAQALSTAYDNYFQRQTSAPDAGGWTQAKINDVEVGLEHA